MLLSAEELRENVGLSVKITALGGVFTGTYTGTIPGRETAATWREKQDRLVVRYGDIVSYLPVEEVRRISADGRKLRRDR